MSFDLMGLATSGFVENAKTTKTVSSGGIGDVAKAGVFNNLINTVGSTITSVFGKNAVTTRTGLLGSSVTVDGKGATAKWSVTDWLVNNWVTVAVIVVVVFIFGKPLMRLIRRRG